MTPESLDFLTSPAGSRLLADLATQDLSHERTLKVMSDLRKHYPPADAAAALEQAKLRRAAVDKFGNAADVMFFTRDALEQASDSQTRQWRATRLSEMVIDAGCGIGADSLTYAQAGCHVLGLELDPLRVAIAAHNAAALGLSERARFERHDITIGLPESCDWAFFDPARRDSQGRRLHAVESYLPPLSTLHQWKNARRVMVKLSPGVALDELREYGGQVEFLSVDGELKEAVLLPSEETQTTRAVLFTGGKSLVWDWYALTDVPSIAEPSGWLLEPDSALIRAGLVQHAAQTWGAHQLDETIAYLTCQNLPDSPWMRAWRILDAMPFNLKKVRAYLAAGGVGKITVKKRGHAMTPEELTAGLKLKGTESRTLVLTRYAGNPYLLICEDYRAAEK